MRYFKRKEAPPVDGNDLLHISLDITVQQRFGMSVGRLVFAFTCCYYQANDCNHNHKHLIVAHEHHLPIRLSKNRGGTLPDIQLRIIREVEPSTVSRQCQIHCTYAATYQEFRIDVWLRVFSTRSTDATGATTTTPPTDSTTLTKLTIATKH